MLRIFCLGWNILVPASFFKLMDLIMYFPEFYLIIAKELYKLLLKLMYFLLIIGAVYYFFLNRLFFESSFSFTAK